MLLAVLDSSNGVQDSHEVVNYLFTRNSPAISSPRLRRWQTSRCWDNGFTGLLIRIVAVKILTMLRRFVPVYHDISTSSELSWCLRHRTWYRRYAVWWRGRGRWAGLRCRQLRCQGTRSCCVLGLVSLPTECPAYRGTSMG